MSKVGFLLGAGFSKALHHEMPVMTELLSVLEKQGKIPGYIPNSVRNDLERTLSYLWTSYPWHTETSLLRNRMDYLNLTQDLHGILSGKEFLGWGEIFQNGMVSRDDWRVILAWILSQPDRSVVLTMNYDTLLERLMIASNSNNWLVYPAPIQRLYGAWNQQREISNPLGRLGNSRFSPALYKLHGCLSWYSLNGMDENSIVYGLDMDEYYLRPQDPTPENYAESLLPVIVPPVADKASMYNNKVLRSQWIGALDGLQQCDEIYCVGYSFPKSDLAMQLFLSEACNMIKTIHLVNPSQDAEIKNRIRTMVGPNRTIDFIDGDDCVEKMTQQLVDDGFYHSANFVQSYEIKS